MTKVTTLKSVTVTEDALDSKGRPIRQMVKHNGRETETRAVNHIRHEANKVIEVDEDLADELVKAGHVRAYSAELDAEPEVAAEVGEGDDDTVGSNARNMKQSSEDPLS